MRSQESVKYAKIVEMEYTTLKDGKIQNCNIILREPVSGECIKIDVTKYLEKEISNGSELYIKDRKIIDEMVAKRSKKKSMTKIYKNSENKYELLKIEKIFKK